MREGREGEVPQRADIKGDMYTGKKKYKFG
jgi:hypothetical protein